MLLCGLWFDIVKPQTSTFLYSLVSEIGDLYTNGKPISYMCKIIIVRPSIHYGGLLETQDDNERDSILTNYDLNSVAFDIPFIHLMYPNTTIIHVHQHYLLRSPNSRWAKGMQSNSFAHICGSPNSE